MDNGIKPEYKPILSERLAAANRGQVFNEFVKECDCPEIQNLPFEKNYQAGNTREEMLFIPDIERLLEILADKLLFIGKADKRSLKALGFKEDEKWGCTIEGDMNNYVGKSVRLALIRAVKEIIKSSKGPVTVLKFKTNKEASKPTKMDVINAGIETIENQPVTRKTRQSFKQRSRRFYSKIAKANGCKKTCKKCNASIKKWKRCLIKAGY